MSTDRAPSAASRDDLAPFRLTAEQRALLPSETDVRSYEEHGWYATPKILPDELLDDAVYGIERYYSGERDHRLPISGGYLNWTPDHGDVLRINDYVSLQCEELQRLVRFPMIGAVAARLARSHEVRLFHDQLICKPPGDRSDQTVVGWHVDRSYWKTCSSDRMLTAWIPMQDCEAALGPVSYIDGSHRWPDTDWMSTFIDRDLAKLEARLTTPGRTIARVPMLLRRGQVSFHHSRTIHGSGPNTADVRRIALTVHVQDAGNRYISAIGRGGREALHVNDLLCRRDAEGRPDYSDADVCPVLWRGESDAGADDVGGLTGEGRSHRGVC